MIMPKLQLWNDNSDKGLAILHADLGLFHPRILLFFLTIRWIRTNTGGTQTYLRQLSLLTVVRVTIQRP